ncbi:hypothetical protein EYF80_049272 [Liparis tanakae]|uniref:Uncharacterized protein n=1 Tax=Liparis tanakae TaxID=230148 RepID=A0A4Z2FHZ3_9TELE|nr:hypothetical protein EYF80_049272 [Liparis tanakae]
MEPSTGQNNERTTGELKNPVERSWCCLINMSLRFLDVPDHLHLSMNPMSSSLAACPVLSRRPGVTHLEGAELQPAKPGKAPGLIRCLQTGRRCSFWR